MTRALQPIKLHSRGILARGSAQQQQAAPSLADAVNAIAELNRAVNAMREANDARLAAERAGRADVVQTEQVNRIAADVQGMQAAVETLSQQLAAARMHNDGGRQVSTEVKAHADAFRTWFRTGQVPQNMRELEIKATLSTDSNPDGGYVVPQEVDEAIGRILGTVSQMRNLATVRTISTGNYKKLHSLGGAGSGWVGEKDSRTNTATPTMVELDFPAMELYAQPAATQNVLDDARIDLGQWLGDEVAITFAEQEGAKFISGDGNKVPFGLLSTYYTKIADASWAWGKIGFAVSGVSNAISDASNNGVDGLKRTKFALKAGYLPNASWLMNRNTVLAVSLLQDSTKNYLWQPSNAVGEPARLLNFPVYQDDNMPDIAANAYPVAFGDFRRAYVIVDRAGITVLRDPYTSKPYVLFYTTKRVGGGVQDFQAYKLLKIST